MNKPVNKGGRPPGAKNKRTLALQRRIQQAGVTPLEYLVSIMVDEDQEQHTRIDAAKAAAPYIHPRLQSTTIQEKPYEGDPSSITNEQLASIIQTPSGSDAPAKKKGSRTTH